MAIRSTQAKLVMAIIASGAVGCFATAAVTSYSGSASRVTVARSASRPAAGSCGEAHAQRSPRPAPASASAANVARARFERVFRPPGPLSADSVYLDVYSQRLRREGDRPVLVWFHGGGLPEGGAREYDGFTLAARSSAAVRIDFMLGEHGFLAHPTTRRL
jgi:carboxylesterase type B